MDAELRGQCEASLEGFKQHVSETQEAFNRATTRAAERGVDAGKKNDLSAHKEFMELQKFFNEVSHETKPERKTASNDKTPGLSSSASIKGSGSSSGFKRMESNSSIKSLGSNASIASLGRSNSGGLDPYKATNSILTDGLRPHRRYIRTGEKSKAQNYQQVLGKTEAATSGAAAITATSVVKKFVAPKIEISPTRMLTHAAMAQYLGRMKWARHDDHRRVLGITAISDFFAERVLAESKKLQFTFFVSAEKLEEMKRAPPDQIVAHCCFKVRRKASDNISALAPPKVNSKQKSMIFAALISDAARTVLVCTVVT
jgi:hypothetical protein